MKNALDSSGSDSRSGDNLLPASLSGHSGDSRTVSFVSDLQDNNLRGREVSEPVGEGDKTVISQRPIAPPEEFYRSMPLAELASTLEGKQLDHFSVDTMIGGGGMGAVFRGVDQRLDRVVAVKVIPSSKRDADTLRRFRLEAQAAARLDHPNIARVYYVGEAEQWNYIVFEFIDGINIRDLVEMEGPLSIDDAVFYTRQVAEALQHAHDRDVVHRDVKPSNVLVTANGVAKLVDMGLARDTSIDKSTADATASGVTLGTFDYISPEQARNPRDADVRSDLYSLGCTLFYMLTGSPPFPDGTALQKLLNHGSVPPPDPRGWREDVSDQLYEVIMKLMAKRPADRYQKPADLVNDLLLLAELENLPRSQAPTTLMLSPTVAQRTLLETNLPWLVAFAFLLGSALWLQSVQSLPTGVTLPGLNFATEPVGALAPADGVRSPGLNVRDAVEPAPAQTTPGRSNNSENSSQAASQGRSPAEVPLRAATDPGAGQSGGTGQPLGVGQSSVTGSSGISTDIAFSLKIPPFNAAANNNGLPIGAPLSESPGDNAARPLDPLRSAVGGSSLPSIDLPKLDAIETLSGSQVLAAAATGATGAGATGATPIDRNEPRSENLVEAASKSSLSPRLNPAGGVEDGGRTGTGRTGMGSTGTGSTGAVGTGSVSADVVVASKRPEGIAPERWEPSLGQALQRLSGKPAVIELHGRILLDRPLVLDGQDIELRAGTVSATIDVPPGAGGAGDAATAFVVNHCKLKLMGVSFSTNRPVASSSPSTLIHLEGNSSLLVEDCAFTVDGQFPSLHAIVSLGGNRTAGSLNASASSAMSPAMVVEIRNSHIRGATSLLRIQQLSQTGRPRQEISVESSLVTIDGVALELETITGALETERIVRLFCRQSTFVTSDGFARMNYQGSAQPLVGLSRTSRGCVFWSRPGKPHIAIHGESAGLMENPNLLLLQGFDNAYDENIENICQTFAKDTRIFDLDFSDGQQEGWFNEKSYEREVRWETGVSRTQPFARSSAGDFQLKPAMFVPGYPTDLLAPPN
jgi:serine/threonine-protein kinase